jgi:hypothetical protein
LDSLFLDLIVVHEKFLQILEIVAPKKILEALITNFIVTQGQNFKIGDKFTIG